MDSTFYSDLENIFSKSRLSAYKKDSADDKTALARYLYNIELCKSLYAPLNVFEISLRNTIDKSLCTFAGNSDWYDTLPFDSSSKNKIFEAKKKICKKGKALTHDRIVAEFTLGFWTSIITTRYSQAAFQSYIIKNNLKKCPASSKNIKNLQQIFEKMRILRNSVSHYERILHWKDLPQQHNQLLECIKWLDESAFQLLSEIDFFDYIFSAGVNPFLVLVSKKWNR